MPHYSSAQTQESPKSTRSRRSLGLDRLSSSNSGTGYSPQDNTFSRIRSRTTTIPPKSRNDTYSRPGTADSQANSRVGSYQPRINHSTTSPVSSIPTSPSLLAMEGAGGGRSDRDGRRRSRHNPNTQQRRTTEPTAGYYPATTSQSGTPPLSGARRRTHTQLSPRPKHVTDTVSRSPSSSTADSARNKTRLCTEEQTALDTPSGTPRQRSMTVQPMSLGFHRRVRSNYGYVVAPDPNMPIDECNNRIDRLLLKVQQTHREYTAHQALTSASNSSPKLPTRLDNDDSLSRPDTGDCSASREARKTGSSSTIATITLSSSSNNEAENDSKNKCTSRTAQGSPESTPVHSASRRPFRNRVPDSARSARADRVRAPGTRVAGSGPTRSTTTAADIRAKTAKLRAKRAAYFAAQAKEESEANGSTATTHLPLLAEPVPIGHADASGPLSRCSPSSGSTKWSDDVGVFEDPEIASMIQEMPVPFRDVEWDKRVYYYHVARTDECFKELTEDIEIGDFSEECLADLLGSKKANRIIYGNSNSSRRKTTRPSNDDDGNSEDSRSREIDAIASWIDEDDDANDTGRSFDWSRDGFGYMEFRRLSKVSLASNSVVSPAAGEGMGKVASNSKGSRLLIDDSSLSPLALKHNDIVRRSDVEGTGMSAYSGAESSLAGGISLSPMAAKLAVEDFNNALLDTRQRRQAEATVPEWSNAAASPQTCAQQHKRLSRPPNVYANLARGLSRISENSSSNDVDEASDADEDTDGGLQRDLGERQQIEDKRRCLELLEAENRCMSRQIRQAQEAIAAMTRLALGAQMRVLENQ